jgi:membrane protease YdiL (CAAX protease family)
MTPDGQLNGRFVFLLALTDTAVLLSLIVWLLVRRGERPWTVFFGDRPPGREIAAGIGSLPLIIALVIGLTLAIRRLLPALRNVPNNPLEGLISDHAGGLWLFLFVVIVAGGVREELQRAFLLHRFRDNLGQPWLGVVITSLSFGMGHTLQGLDAAVITGALGATWGIMYLTRRGALASMVSHSLFNSAELIRAFLQ